jgi:hypothetical protein
MIGRRGSKGSRRGGRFLSLVFLPLPLFSGASLLNSFQDDLSCPKIRRYDERTSRKKSSGRGLTQYSPALDSSSSDHFSSKTLVNVSCVQQAGSLDLPPVTYRLCRISVELSLLLESNQQKAGYPKSFRVLLLWSNSKCRLMDLTHWILIPAIFRSV